MSRSGEFYVSAVMLGLRVSEACSIDVEDLSLERGHRTVTVLNKGSKLAVIPLPPRVPGPSTWRPGNGRRGRFFSPGPATD